LKIDDWLNLDGPVTSLKLEYCWVCREKFTEYGGKPNFFAHEHHLVPRAYGGKDGPTYSLCDSHHNALHRIAERLDKGKQYNEFLTGENDSDRRLLWLATVVINSKRITANDPNKAMPVTFVAKGITKQRLKKLKTVYKLSFANILELAVRSLYFKHFQSDVPTNPEGRRADKKR
jgi:hypothetical protein